MYKHTYINPPTHTHTHTHTKVADMIGTEHHEFHFTVQVTGVMHAICDMVYVSHEWPLTVQEGIDAVQDVIYHLETYDVTTIRAGTPMFILARKIKAMGVKMVLSGADVICRVLGFSLGFSLGLAWGLA